MLYNRSYSKLLEYKKPKGILAYMADSSRLIFNPLSSNASYHNIGRHLIFF